jgi:hypothetical protein
MPAFTFIALTFFIFLAIVGGIIGILLEGRRIAAGSGAHNPATHDTVFPIVGWATLFAIYLLVENVGTQNMTPGFRQQLATLWMLPLNYAILATARLIWRSARRIHALVRGTEPVVWRSVPYLGVLRFPVLLLGAILTAALEFWSAQFSLSFFLLASIAVLFTLIRKS